MKAVRPIALVLLVAAGVSGCNCGTPPATPITLVAQNDLDYDIFVLNTSGQAGMAVARDASGGLAPVAEAPACDCLACASACSDTACDCNPTAKVHRIKKGESFSRTFDGTEHAATRASCGTGDFGPVCYGDGTPIEAGTYTLQLCYADAVPGASTAGDDFAADVSTDELICVTQQYDYPDTKTWQIAPPQPAQCSASAPCPSGQLCQRGVCSAKCLANAVPALGSGWDVSVAIIDDQGFFTSTGTDVVKAVGTGQVGQAIENGTDMRLTLTRAVGVGHTSAQIDVRLPNGVSPVPFIGGETVDVTVYTRAATDDTKASAAVAVRGSDGTLLLAADMGRGGAMLASDDLAPFQVTGAGTAFACDEDDVCGRRLHADITFTAGASSVSVDPGLSQTVDAGSQSYVATAVENYADRAGSPTDECDPEGLFIYALTAQRSF